MAHQQITCRGRQFIHTPQCLDYFQRDLSYVLFLLIEPPKTQRFALETTMKKDRIARSATKFRERS